MASAKRVIIIGNRGTLQWPGRSPLVGRSGGPEANIFLAFGRPNVVKIVHS